MWRGYQTESPACNKHNMWQAWAKFWEMQMWNNDNTMIELKKHKP